MGSGASGTPRVSVVIPTYRRAAMLRRAVESVLAQSCQEWELIVSDDERVENESRAYMEEVARRDNRVRVLVNGGEAGQAGNLNNAMAAARGEWIKPLFDDDELAAGCLRRMLEAVSRSPSASLARCLTEVDMGERGVKRESAGRRARLEALSGADALLAMFVQDVEVGTPTQAMVRREVVQGGAWFPRHDMIVGAVDELWYMQLLRHGDLLLVNELLCRQHQAGHSSITSRLTPEAFDREILLVREMQFQLLRGEIRAPSLAAAQRALLIERALWRMAKGRVLEGIRMLAELPDPEAWSLAGRWALRRMMPGRFEAIRRRVVAAQGTPALER